MGWASGQPDSEVMRTLVGRLADDDPVVRLAAHEELRKRSGLRLSALFRGQATRNAPALATLEGLVGTGHGISQPPMARSVAPPSPPRKALPAASPQVPDR